MARPPSALDVFRARVRRIQLTIGLGFIAIVLGSIVAAPLHMRVAPRIVAMGSEVVAFIFFAIIARLWILGALPLLCYAVARVLPVRPVPTAVGAALTGELIGLAIDGLSGTLPTLLQQPELLATRIITAAVGVGLSIWAISSARAQVAEADAAAVKAAEAKKSEYDEFVKESERVAAARDKPAEMTAPTPVAPAATEPAPSAPLIVAPQSTDVVTATDKPETTDATSAQSPKPPSGTA